MSLNRAEQTWPEGEQFMVTIFEFEYCSECGGDSDDHILCVGPFGQPFAMCKFAPIVDGVWFRNGQVIEPNTWQFDADISR